jgi:hypothetical protein
MPGHRHSGVLCVGGPCEMRSVGYIDGVGLAHSCQCRCIGCIEKGEGSTKRPFCPYSCWMKRDGCQSWIQVALLVATFKRMYPRLTSTPLTNEKATSYEYASEQGVGSQSHVLHMCMQGRYDHQPQNGEVWQPITLTNPPNQLVVYFWRAREIILPDRFA